MKKDCVTCKHRNSALYMEPSTCYRCHSMSLYEPDEFEVYVRSDVHSVIDMYKNAMNIKYGYKAQHPVTDSYKITNVIFNNPATIVFWADGTKTVVKCQDGDIYDPEKGLSMAIAKKAYGNKGSYCNVIKKWTEKYEEERIKRAETVASIFAGFGTEEISEAFNRAFRRPLLKKK